MVVLTGKNLGERHQELNYKVAEFVSNKKNFNDIKIEKDVSDVDKLYKIDIASQYKDIDYIVEILKSGDSLYITRALKCHWLYHDDNSHIINAEYLHVNIFPFMSIRMKKKVLTTIAMHIQNYDHAANFYTYCKKNQFPNIAFKFLNSSSEELKTNVLKNGNLDQLYPYIDTNLQNFVGNSFVLATAYIEMCDEFHRTSIIHNLRYLYTVSNEKYLEFLEKYEIVSIRKPNALKRLGIRISRDIMLKYKNRVLENPLLYVNKLNKAMLAKYSSISEAKKYISSLIPQCVKEFWYTNFCKAYDYILNIIPINEKFEYVKQLFNTNYPGEPFETTYDFYELKYYNMMSINQRELWALQQIDDQKEILGNGNDYIWYKFVNIEKALIDIKKYVIVTPDSDKRASYVNILVEATRDQEDLKKVLDYFYERHVNESEDNKNNFIDKVMSAYNVFELNIECWEALNKLFYSLDIYSIERYGGQVYRAVAVPCHILHNIDMPEALLHFIDLDVNYPYLRALLEKLGKEKSDIVLQYLIKLFVDKLKPFERDPSNKKLGKSLKKYVNNILNLLQCFGKNDDECPEIVKRFMAIHFPKPEETKTLTAKEIYCFLKTDAKLAVDALRQDLNITYCRNILKTTLRKLKVYFYNDVAQEYINFLDRKIQNLALEHDMYSSDVSGAIFAIFHLGDESFKVSLMKKYQPTKAKIDHGVIDRNLLNIQEAICKFVSYSRPPVPLKYVLQYIKGDYVHFCIPMFNMYLANLPQPLLMKFTESLLDAPISIKKHGLRLAFHCFDHESLKSLLLNTWKKSKNVSLRMIIYKSLFGKLIETTSSERDDQHARILYEALKIFTSDLHQDDHQDLFDLISHGRRHLYLPTPFIGDYLQTAWNMVIKLAERPVNIDRQINIINKINMNINLLRRDFVRKEIIDEQIHEILEQRRLLLPDELQNSVKLRSAKLNLIANYIVQYSNNEELQESLAIVSHIFKKCVELWQEKYKDTFIIQRFYFDLIRDIENIILDVWYKNPKDLHGLPILNHVLDTLKDAMPLKEIYLPVWNLKLTIFLGIGLSVGNAVSYEGDGDSKSLIREEILSDNIARQIEQYMQELATKQQFYPVFLSEISRLLKDRLQNYCLSDMKNLDIIFSQSLVNIGLKETHLLTLMILPVDVPEGMAEMHTKILNKIQEFENEEVQSYLYFKFLSPFNINP